VFGDRGAVIEIYVPRNSSRGLPIGVTHAGLNVVTSLF
jgi:hypothetical protein